MASECFGFDNQVMDPNILPLFDLMVHSPHMRNYYLLPAQNVAALLSVLFMTRPVILLSGLRHDQFVCAIDMHDVKQIQEQMRSKTGFSLVPFPWLPMHLNILPLYELKS